MNPTDMSLEDREVNTAFCRLVAGLRDVDLVVTVVICVPGHAQYVDRCKMRRS